MEHLEGTMYMTLINIYKLLIIIQYSTDLVYITYCLVYLYIRTLFYSINILLIVILVSSCLHLSSVFIYKNTVLFY